MCDDAVPNVRIDTARALLPVGQQLSDNRQQPEKAAILAKLQAVLAKEDEDPDVRDAARSVVDALG